MLIACGNNSLTQIYNNDQLYKNNGLPIGTIGFGIVFVYSDILVPFPPQNNKFHFTISSIKLIMTLFF